MCNPSCPQYDLCECLGLTPCECEPCGAACEPECNFACPQFDECECLGIDQCFCDPCGAACRPELNDCNANGVVDDCENPAAGDFTADGVIDLADHAFLVGCLSDPGTLPDRASCTFACLYVFDADFDGDVDLRDASYFLTLWP